MPCWGQVEAMLTQVGAKLGQVEAKLGQLGAKLSQVGTKLVPSWCQVKVKLDRMVENEVRRAKMGQLGVQDLPT